MPKTHDWYQIRAAADNSAEVLIYGDIGESWFGDSVTAGNLVRELQGIDASEINVRINSYGGSVSDGIAIYNALRRHNATINVHIDGVAISIASLIAMAGDKVYIGQNALFMVHAPWGGAVGNAKELREYADVLDTFASAMASSYARKTGKPVDEIMPLLTDGADHWFTADEAVASGYADETTEPVQVAASLNLSRYRNIPAAAAVFTKPIEDIVMPDKIKPAAQVITANTPATPAAPVVADNVVSLADVRADLQNRNQAIRAKYQPFLAQDGVHALLADVLADVHLTEQQAGDKLLAKLGHGIEPLTPAGAGGVTLKGDNIDQRDKTITAMSNAALMRVGMEKNDASNPYRNLSLSDMAKASCETMGLNPRSMGTIEATEKALRRDQVRGAQTTSDFPVILENIMHRMVLQGYTGTPSKFERFCKVGDVSDFRAWSRIVPGLIGNLDTVNEAGEYKDKPLPDGVKNTITATRKGNIIHVTPEVIVNDDMGWIKDMAMGLGAAGARTIDRAVITLLVSNPTLSDGYALFHANHANYLASGSGTAPSVTSLDIARTAMAKQTAPGADAEYLDLRPAVALCPTGLYGDFVVLNDAQYDPDTANKLQKPNKVRGLFGDVVDTPRLTLATGWYTFADPNIAPCIEVVFLNGQRAPRVVEEENFRTSGMAVKVELPFGVGAIDHRGAYFNYGA